MAEHPQNHRLNYSIAEITAMTGFSRAFVAKHVASGELKSRKVGRKRIIFAADLQRWLEGDDAATPSIEDAA